MIAKLKEKFSLLDPAYAKGITALVAVVVIVAATMAVLTGENVKLKNKINNAENFRVLSESYAIKNSALGSAVTKFEKDSIGGGADIIIEKIGKAIGISEKIKSFRSVGVEKTAGFTKDVVAVELKGVSMNEMVNLLFEMKNSESALLVEALDMNQQLSDANLLDVKLKVALVTKG
ncbi:MAG: hypothetical protein KAR06_02050 [Deltaproteobacteria bacterium]|nr:hypothetical protein [Deltaproteobacteria bacterium]